MAIVDPHVPFWLPFRRTMPLEHLSFFFFNDTATTEIYTLSLHDALPIYSPCRGRGRREDLPGGRSARHGVLHIDRSEEHTSELQSRQYLVCRLLLEKKNTNPFRSSIHCRYSVEQRFTSSRK